MGLVILGALGLYLLLSISVVMGAVSYAQKNGKSAKRWAIGSAFIMYSLVFWDWIPTVVVHQFYCAKDSGFWVYKTLEQWKTENPGGMEELVAYAGVPSKRKGDMENYADTYFLNDRFNWVVKHNGQFLLNRWRHEQEVVDTKTNSVLARYVDFSTSQEQLQAGWNGWKFWLANEHCSGGGSNQDELRNFRNNFMGVKK